MALKLSIFTTVTNPQYRGDTYRESLSCYKELADEVVVVNGGGHITEHSGVKYVNYKWDREFDWPFIGKQFTRGYKACSGDWVIHADLDFIFHQKDFGKIRQALSQFENSAGLSFYKHQFVLPDRFNLKSRLVLAVNKRLLGDRIKFDSGGDLCQPSVDGQLMHTNEMPEAGVSFWNYEKLAKTKDQIRDDQGRMERAYYRHFNQYQLAIDGTDESAYQGWLGMQTGRFNKPQEQVGLDDHPKYIKDTIKNLTPKLWGYSGFGLLEKGVYA